MEKKKRVVNDITLLTKMNSVSSTIYIFAGSPLSTAHTQIFHDVRSRNCETYPSFHKDDGPHYHNDMRNISYDASRTNY